MNKLKKLKTYITEVFDNMKFRYTCTRESNRVKRLYLNELKNPSEHNSVYPRLGGIEGFGTKSVYMEYERILKHLVAISMTMDNVRDRLIEQGMTSEDFERAIETNVIDKFDDEKVKIYRECVVKALNIVHEHMRTDKKDETVHTGIRDKAFRDI
jgi:hypothetical protein